MIAFRFIKRLKGQVTPALCVSESDFDILTSSITLILPNHPTEFEGKKILICIKDLLIFHFVLFFNNPSD